MAFRQTNIRPDRWIQHHNKCGATDMPEGFYYCCCPPGWPRTAAYWNGETAIGSKQVAALIKRYIEAKDGNRSN